jgi:hypothetical protein
MSSFLIFFRRIYFVLWPIQFPFNDTMIIYTYVCICLQIVVRKSGFAERLIKLGLLAR